MKVRAEDGASLEEWVQWLAEAITKIKYQKQRPSEERICSAVRHLHSCDNEQVLRRGQDQRLGQRRARSGLGLQPGSEQGWGCSRVRAGLGLQPGQRAEADRGWDWRCKKYPKAVPRSAPRGRYWPGLMLASIFQARHEAWQPMHNTL